jgi:hypothetical protein
MDAILLNTKQVRKMGSAFCGVNAQWTDKTSDNNTDRRVVVWNLWNTKDADALVAHFKAQGVINEIKRTGVDADYMTRTSGGEYVRVFANIG